jgi:hypothetical protein
MIQQLRNRKRKTAWSLIALALVAVLALAACGGDDDDDGGLEWEASVATLSVDLGSAELTSGDDTRSVAAAETVEVKAGDTISVAANGQATVTFYDGAQARLAPDTVLEVRRLQAAGESHQVEMAVLVGQAFNTVSHALDADSTHEITTANATISVRGTEYVVVVRDNDLTQVTTMDGSVDVTAGESTQTVLCGYGVWLDPAGAMSELLVWGQAELSITTPLGEAVDFPVMFTKIENGQDFYYRSGDRINVPLGTYELVVHAPGPLRMTGIWFPEDTQPEEVQSIAIPLSAITLNVLDPAGEPLTGDRALRVTLRQGELQNTIVTVPGDPIVVGPGPWVIEAAWDDAPDQTQTVEVTVEPGKQVSASLADADFGASAK